jgi:hypothetical protein
MRTREAWEEEGEQRERRDGSMGTGCLLDADHAGAQRRFGHHPSDNTQHERRYAYHRHRFSPPSTPKHNPRKMNAELEADEEFFMIHVRA